MEELVVALKEMQEYESLCLKHVRVTQIVWLVKNVVQ